MPQEPENYFDIDDSVYSSHESHSRILKYEILGKRRREYAPNDGTPMTSGSCIYVDLAPNERVVWDFTNDANGNKIVSGYTIIRTNDTK